MVVVVVVSGTAAVAGTRVEASFLRLGLGPGEEFGFLLCFTGLFLTFAAVCCNNPFVAAIQSSNVMGDVSLTLVVH